MYKWLQLVDKETQCEQVVSIVLVGKYTRLEDSYASVIKALNHSTIHLKKLLKITYVEGSDLEDCNSQVNPEKFKSAWKSIR